ncbi:MAG TPA: folylpolyglutamate synthase/dihydrofolate synthase family protein [Xanthobacteraceae bacterium]|nr:folylpolyglutamate synthase/dihydrofolate synthase family protein [Xanthobacteraceae bacterium]
MTPIDSILARLLALHPKRIDLSLDRIERLLDALGHPERRLPPVIHVAGTNGKGSTVAFARAMLEAAGRRVHVYTSPHLVRFNERFRIASPDGGKLVSNDELAAALTECEQVNGSAPMTVFEIETAAAFLLFSRHPADVLLLEVGLGGRLDATNVVEKPLVSVITPVSLDHAEFLGDNLEGMAAEKAGIIKRGVPVVVGPQQPEALAVIERRAAALRAPLHVAGEHWNIHREHGRLVYQDDDGLLDLPLLKLQGRHQFDNAGVAIAALRASRIDIPQSSYDAGLVRADWPARLQLLAQGRLSALAPTGSELWLDGGHNPDGSRVVAAALGDIEERVSRPLVLIVGMLATKDSAGFLRNFAGLARRLIAVPIPRQEKSLPAETIAETAREVGIPADTREDLKSALTAVVRMDLHPSPRILITGSLYLAGEVLALNGTPPD